MIAHSILAGGTFFGMFVLFLVAGKSLNMMIAQLNRLLYLLQREYDYYQELVEVHKAMAAAGETEEEDA
jgi:hypothetical protein